jgi:soluble lytic murein transglycosylase-like protein
MVTKAAIIAMVLHYSQLYGVEPATALSVVKVESNFDAKAIGPKGEIGLFQLNPSAFKQYSKKHLTLTRNNIIIGVKFLREMQRNCVHKNGLNYLVCFNFGIENAKRVKHPELFPYVKRVTKVRNKYLKEGEI